MRRERRDTKCAQKRVASSFKTTHKKAMLFPEGVEFQPASILKDDEIGAFSKHERSLYRDQAILFGKDVINPQRKKFKKFYHTSTKDIDGLLANMGSKDQLKKSMKLMNDYEMDLSDDEFEKPASHSLLIKFNSIWKYYFDLIALVFGAYSVFENAYFSAFGIPNNIGI